MEADHAETAARSEQSRRPAAAPPRAASSSAFTRIRMAWNVRVAGCFPGSRVGTAAAITSASWPRARRSVPRPRAATTARAMRREPLLAEPVQRVGESRAREARAQPLRRGLTGLVVHPHVERPVLHETEARDRLRRAAAMRPRGPATRRPTPAFHILPFAPARQAARTTPDQRETWLRAEPQPRPRRIGLRVTIDRAPRDRPDPSCREDRGGMPATTERRVAVAPVGADSQRRPALPREVPACAPARPRLQRKLLELGWQIPRLIARLQPRFAALVPVLSRPRARTGSPARSTSPDASRPAYSRSFGGISTRPCESSSRSVACPTISRCSRRA